MALINGQYTFSGSRMPSQSVPLKEKLEKPKSGGNKVWSQKCLDAAESIGRQQYTRNLALRENYEMVKGKLLPSHYFDVGSNGGMIAQLTAEFELPNYLRHYDIIGQVINEMSAEYLKRPDTFRIVQVGEKATNEFLRNKADLLKKYAFSKVTAEINKKLIEQGIDPDKKDFNSEEEQQQYSQQLDGMRKEMTPTEIQNFMTNDFLTQAEIWSQSHRDISKEQFRLDEKEKIEFEDSLITDRCFRHFYITPTGYGQETWNPVNTFFLKSDEESYVEKGEMVGRILQMSIAQIIDKYGFIMTKKELDLLQNVEKNKKDVLNSKDDSWIDNYRVPFSGYPEYSLLKQVLPNYPLGADIPMVDENFLSGMNKTNSLSFSEGVYNVTEVYWKTQKFLYKITYFDNETGEKMIQLVDETFIMPKDFIESKEIFSDEQDINTYVQTTINEVWKGIKINTSINNQLKEDLYIGVGPNDFQFKGDEHIYGCKLPVCGSVFSMRNSTSMSLVDLMKPYQIGVNVAFNQLYQLMEKESAAFMIFDVAMLLDNKDWGGKDAWDKWMLAANQFGMLPVDTSPKNIQESIGIRNGLFPKIIDMDLASRMASRIKIVQFFEEQGLKQIGFNAYRTGDYASTATATGIQQGAAKSYNQTESYFTNFSNYNRRCIEMDLNIAQFVESRNKNVTAMYTKSDNSKALITVLGTDLLMADLNVYVSNSQENLRQLEMIRQYALQNNTAGASPVDAIDMIMMNNPHQIRKQMEISYNKFLEQQGQAQQLKQQELQQTEKQDAAELEQKQKQFEEQLQNNIDVAQIKEGAKIINTEPTLPDAPDNSNAINAQLKAQQNNDNNNLKQRQLEQKSQSDSNNLNIKLRDQALKQRKIDNDLRIQQLETETARIQKGKDIKSKK